MFHISNYCNIYESPTECVSTDADSTQWPTGHLQLLSFTLHRHLFLPLCVCIYPWLRKQLIHCEEVFQSSDFFPELFIRLSWLRDLTGGSARMRNFRETGWGIFFFLTETSWYNCLMIICIIGNTHTQAHKHMGTADKWSFRSLYKKILAAHCYSML